MRILLVNDDGYYEPGIRVLENVVKDWASELWVVAPNNNCSGIGSAITYTRGIGISEVAERRFRIEGTPVDCTMLALHHLMCATPPDLVLSGVNAGQNVGELVRFSGTINAAMAASNYGFPAMALSQAYGFDERSVAAGAQFGPSEVEALKTIKHALKAAQDDPLVTLNINFPACEPNEIKGIKWTHVSPRDRSFEVSFKKPSKDMGEDRLYWYHFSPLDIDQERDDEVAALRDNFISISRILVR